MPSSHSTPNQSSEPFNKRPWAFKLALCLLSPFFFLTAVFAILAPLPLLYLFLGINDRKEATSSLFMAIPLGFVICWVNRGPVLAFLFLLLAVLPALVMGKLLEQKTSPEKSIASAIGAILLIGLFAIGAWAQFNGTAFIPELKSSLTESVEIVAKQVIANSQNEEAKQEFEKILKNPNLLFQELGGLAISMLFLLCSVPLIALIRWNPNAFLQRTGIKRDFLRNWRAPELLIWPSLLCLSFLVYEVKYLTLIANNLLKPLLVIYFFHGMSILAFYLDLFRVKGPLRALFYSFGIIFLMPMIISFGFFDLWFNFRDRTRKKKLPKASE